MLETSKKRCLTVGRRSRDLRPLFSKIFLMAWNVLKTLLDGRRQWRDLWSLSRDCFSNFFQNFSKLHETSAKSFSTVGQRSRDFRQLLRDRSATFVPFLAIFVETSKKFVWKPVKSRLTLLLFCFRGFCERLPHMLASICLSRSYSYYYFYD